MTSRPIPQCLTCAHYRPSVGNAQTCAAYPRSIPDAIWWNEADHRQTQPGDHGTTWKSRDGAEFPDYAMSEAP